MLNVSYGEGFLKKIEKIKDAAIKDRIKKQIKKILENPDIGKPMRYGRKGTREIYIPPYRLAYSHIASERKVIFLELYHKDEQ